MTDFQRVNWLTNMFFGQGIGRVCRRLSRVNSATIGMTISALALFLFALHSYARDVGPFGGGGGGAFRITCEPGGFVAGFDVMASHVIERIAPVCGYRNKAGTYGRPWAGGTSRSGNPAVTATLHKPRCQPGAIMTILHVFADKTPLVNRLGFTCWHPETHAMTDSLPEYGGEPGKNQRLVCPIGEVATGLYGRAGTAIDALGLICEKWENVQPASPSSGFPAATTTLLPVHVRTYMVFKRGGTGIVPPKTKAFQSFLDGDPTVGYQYTNKISPFGDTYHNFVWRLGLWFDRSQIPVHTAASLRKAVLKIRVKTTARLSGKWPNPQSITNFDSCAARIGIGQSDWWNQSKSVDKYSTGEWVPVKVVLNPGIQVGPNAEYDITPIVRDWISGLNNFGLILLGAEENLNAFTMGGCLTAYEANGIQLAIWF